MGLCVHLLVFKGFWGLKLVKPLVFHKNKVRYPLDGSFAQAVSWVLCWIGPVETWPLHNCTYVFEGELLYRPWSSGGMFVGGSRGVDLNLVPGDGCPWREGPRGYGLALLNRDNDSLLCGNRGRNATFHRGSAPPTRRLPCQRVRIVLVLRIENPQYF